MKKLAYLSLSCALVVGCSSTPDKAPDGSTALMGTSLSNRMGMVSIFPPREDVRVGDLYVYGSNPEEGDEPTPIDSVPRYGSLEGVTAAVQEQYNERPDFPATPDEYLPSNDGTPAQRAWSEASFKEGVFMNEDPSDRLRMVVIPPVTLSREAAHGVVPGDAVNMAAGGIMDDWESVTLRVQAAESYALDLDDLLEFAIERDSVGRMILKQPYRDKIGFCAGQSSDSVWVRIVSEVLYMRAAQISIMGGSGEPDDELRASELTLERDSAPDEAGEVLDPAFAAIVRAQAINKAIRDDGADVLPDGFVRFLSLSENYLSMQRIWRRPVAIGVRGLTLEVVSVTGEVLSSGMIGKPLKSHVPAPATPEGN